MSIRRLYKIRIFDQDRGKRNFKTAAYWSYV